MIEIFESDIPKALRDFTQRFVDVWQSHTGYPPLSEALFGIDSPCAIKNTDNAVYWLTQPVNEELSLHNVELALNLQLRPEIQQFYTTQYAGDMTAKFSDISLSLIQVWSAEDFVRLQENIIGHLVTQRRLKISPTVFIATTDAEMSIVSVCNVTGEVVLEQFGSKRRRSLAPSLAVFLSQLTPEYRG
jgi:SecY interacting protein Syd